jgi:hypothetical protein
LPKEARERLFKQLKYHFQSHFLFITISVWLVLVKEWLLVLKLLRAKGNRKNKHKFLMAFIFSEHHGEGRVEK